MSGRLKAVALAIAEHVQQYETEAGRKLKASFKDPMRHGAVTPNGFTVPVVLLKELIDAAAEKQPAELDRPQTKKQRTPAEHAVMHVLKRVKADPRLAWLIGPGSESFELLMVAGAAIEGCGIDAYRDLYQADLQTLPWPREEVSQ